MKFDTMISRAHLLFRVKKMSTSITCIAFSFDRWTSADDRFMPTEKRASSSRLRAHDEDNIEV